MADILNASLLSLTIACLLFLFCNNVTDQFHSQFKKKKKKNICPIVRILAGLLQPNFIHAGHRMINTASH